jgi:hypothetical protein
MVEGATLEMDAPEGLAPTLPPAGIIIKNKQTQESLGIALQDLII